MWQKKLMFSTRRRTRRATSSRTAWLATCFWVRPITSQILSQSLRLCVECQGLCTMARQRICYHRLPSLAQLAQQLCTRRTWQASLFRPSSSIDHLRACLRLCSWITVHCLWDSYGQPTKISATNYPLFIPIPFHHWSSKKQIESTFYPPPTGHLLQVNHSNLLRRCIRVFQFDKMLSCLHRNVEWRGSGTATDPHCQASCLKLGN